MVRLSDPIPTLSDDGLRIYQRLLARRERHGVGLYGPYVPLFHHPRLAQRIEELGYFYKYESELPRDRYQFVVLAFARRVGAEFEYRDHVRHAQAAGVPDKIISALDEHAALTEPYASLLRVVDSALAHENLPQDLQDRVIADVGVQGLIEVVTLCGFYGLIAIVNAAFDVPIEEAG
jgi:4-carboxymuconolactone decarboxylase